MNRRGFLGSLFGAVAGVVLDQAIPLGRVWSFPTEIVVARALPINDLVPIEWITRESLEILKRNLVLASQLRVEWRRDHDFLAGDAWPVGSRAPVRFPQSYVVADDEPDEFAGIDDVNEYD